ncbi:MAG TPA: helix-turn-helix domain-containing protein, partial [Planctomycetota bacterium]|nr:helix-turn-helix domain-containing protein [Planctomycetota bacterium]
QIIEPEPASPALLRSAGRGAYVFEGRGPSFGLLARAEEQVAAELTPRQRAILEWARTEGEATRSACAARFRVSPQAAYRDLDALVRAGLLRRTSAGRGARYGHP